MFLEIYILWNSFLFGLNIIYFWGFRVSLPYVLTTVKGVYFNKSSGGHSVSVSFYLYPLKMSSTSDISHLDTC